MRTLLAALVAVALLVATLPVGALVRPLPVIEAAIHHSGPQLSKATVRRYAATIRAECKTRGVDPLTPISMIYYESHWNPRVINAKDPRYSVGLMQTGVVKRGTDCPSKALIDSPGCQAAIAARMDGVFSIRRGMMGITIRRKHCRKLTGKPALFARWLSSYQGYDGRKGVTCNQRKVRGRWRDLPVPSKTARVIQYRLRLIRHLRRKGLL